MKMLIASVLVLIAVSSAKGDKNEPAKCSPPDAEVPEEFKDMTAGCFEAMRGQIQTEIGASMQYLAMGAHFARDTINRPGFSEFFFKAAGEEREHAHKLIEYLLMRGNLTTDLSTLITIKPANQIIWTNGLEALKAALRYEASVTKSIKTVIKMCEDDEVDTNKKHNNDYHLVDYLTGVYLEEQYHGQRDLAGKISTLGRMMESHKSLGEFLFDKKLME